MVNKIVLILALITVLQSVAFAWSECKTEFYLDVPIQIIDNNTLTAPGVNVSMTYQKKDDYFFPGQQEYVTTDAVLTDSDGMATFKIKNDVPNSKYLNCNLVLHVNYLNFTKNYTFNLGTFYGKYIINLPAKRVNVFMIDSEGRPISGTMQLYPAKEFVLNTSASVLLPFGSTPGYLIFNGHRQGMSLNVDNSTPGFVNAVFRTYDVNVSVFDDSGNGIPFRIQVSSEDPINATETVRLRLVDNPVSLKISAYGRETFKQINPEKEKDILVYYDIHAPEISNVDVVPEEDGTVSIVYTVLDKGNHASSIRETGVYIDGVYYSASLKYSSAKVTFTKSGSFSFSIVATDNDGNKADVSADYVSGSKPVINESSNSSTNGEVPPVKKGDDWGNLAVIIVIVAILVIVVFFYVKSNYTTS